ncbi:hypothetical protein [Streptomyces sp. SP18CS02]|uniref:hypothetical protein n=1 Tax=Streptomyces sp. SP18CS02 TaxID=3002531 RepID=UPI002E76886B|nr:hypothetical protein [Streptomyces sp. SP18CS02]MEE1753175.1 hypothetical protein [Streptomyces sp. SP18CS02]
MNHVAFDACDIQRLQHAVDYAHHASKSPLETLLPPWIPGHLKREIKSRCTVSHCATLLFPASEDSALEYFKGNGWRAAATIPSVLVKRRLVARHLLPQDAEILVTRLCVTDDPGPEVEVFLFPRCSPGYSSDVSDEERVHGFENHVGLFLGGPEPAVLASLADGLEAVGGMLFEGSAHNPHENTTMLYFAPSARVARVRRRFPRWELQCSGDLSAVAQARAVRADELELAYNALRENSSSGLLAQRASMAV